jgi:hypothetical protein
MKQNLPLMSAWFVVTDMKFSPHECTDHFGIQPTKVSLKGDVQPGIGLVVPHSSWSIKTEKRRLDSTDKCLRLLLDTIWPKRKQIKDYAKRKALKITFILTLTGHDRANFLYEFTPETIAQLSYFQAPLHLDII